MLMKLKQLKVGLKEHIKFLDWPIPWKMNGIFTDRFVDGSANK